MLAAQALASLNIAQAHRSRCHSTKSKYIVESAQETSGPIKRSYENARMCSHEWAFVRFFLLVILLL